MTSSRRNQRPRRFIVKLFGGAPDGTPSSAKTPWVTADARVIPLPNPALLRLLALSSPHVNKNDSERPSADEAHISVEVAYLHQASRDVFHRTPKASTWPLSRQALPALSHPRNRPTGLGPLRKWKDAFLAYFDTGGPATAGHQRNHQVGRPCTARATLPQLRLRCSSSQEARRLHLHSTLKSPLICPLVDYLKTCLAVRALSLCIKGSCFVVGCLFSSKEV